MIHFIVVRSTASINQVDPSQQSSGSSSGIDLALDDAAVASGKKVVKELKSKLKADSDLLSFKFLSLDTLICQNECSGHGKCHQATRTCVCEPFWLENFVRTRLFDGESNCGKHGLLKWKLKKEEKKGTATTEAFKPKMLLNRVREINWEYALLRLDSR